MIKKFDLKVFWNVHELGLEWDPYQTEIDPNHCKIDLIIIKIINKP